MATVGSLQDHCIDKLADDLELLATKSEDEQNKHVWYDSGQELPGDVPEKLLYKLSKRGTLTDRMFSFFKPERGHLRFVTLPDARQITENGLNVLKSHPLQYLDICHMSLTLFDVLKSIGPHNLKRLKNLRCTFLDLALCQQSFSCCTDSFPPKFDSLQYLSLISIQLTNKQLDVIVSKTPILKSLDISDNLNITDISPLQKLAEQLQVLIMHRLRFLSEDRTVDTLCKLKNLTSLDLSLSYVWHLPGNFQAASLLCDPSNNPNLTSLDLSGRLAVPEIMLGKFLDAHPSLTFLGLSQNDSAYYSMFDKGSPDYRSGIEVAGTAYADQMKVLLKRPPRRHLYEYLLQ